MQDRREGGWVLFEISAGARGGFCLRLAPKGGCCSRSAPGGLLFEIGVEGCYARFARGGEWCCARERERAGKGG